MWFKLPNYEELINVNAKVVLKQTKNLCRQVRGQKLFVRLGTLYRINWDAIIILRKLWDRCIAFPCSVLTKIVINDSQAMHLKCLYTKVHENAWICWAHTAENLKIYMVWLLTRATLWNLKFCYCHIFECKCIINCICKTTFVEVNLDMKYI